MPEEAYVQQTERQWARYHLPPLRSL
jgi:hypothetical protein